MRNERMYNEFIELVTTDAASRKEGLIADKLVEKLTAMGLTVTRDNAGESFGGECGNVIAVLEGTLPGSLLMCSHMDRMPNGLGIKPVERDGVLYTDGTTILAADDISGVCAILEGLRRVIESGREHCRIEVLFTVGEELALCGFRAFDMSQLQSRIGFFFDSPGGVGRIVNGAPGLYKMSAELKGLAAHAGNEPEKGIDATKAACEMITTLKTGRLDHQTTANFPIIRTGANVRNAVCDYAYIEGEARSRDTKTLLDYVESFKTTCQEISAKYGTELKLECSEVFLPFYIEESQPVMQYVKAACEKVGLNYRAENGGGGMDANIANAKGMTAVGVATGYTKNHTINENLVLEDFFKSGELAAEIVWTVSEASK